MIKPEPLTTTRSSDSFQPENAAAIVADEDVSPKGPANYGVVPGVKMVSGLFPRNAVMCGMEGGSGIVADSSGAGSYRKVGGETGAIEGNEGNSAEEQAPRKRKRNKPTLSCEECVERKTKCDRGRPHCLACIRRGTDCVYQRDANSIADSTRQTHIRQMNGPGTKPKQQTLRQMPSIYYDGLLPSPASNTSGYNSRSSPESRRRSDAELLLSNIPHTNPSASNIYGIGSEHPFCNYWTLTGGLAEVVQVLPAKEQADILMTRWFDCVDPIYPLIQRRHFLADYERFWSLSVSEKNAADASFLGLVLIMLAMGTQFMHLPADSATRSETSEFYASASHQALRMSSYMNKPTIRSIQAMVLMTYFLLNDNHPSDGWAFAGILSRQSYAMGLNRDPAILNPGFTLLERQERRRLWQAVLIQDTFMTVLLKLPPTATHADVNLNSFDEDEMATGPGYEELDNNDVGYIKSMWTLALLVQETISSPRSLSLPLTPTPRHRTQLLSRFREAYRSFPDVFRSWDESSISELAKHNNRLVRQTLFLTSNYYHCLMLVQAEEDTVDGSMNLRGAMEAAHDAIKSYFTLHRLFECDANVWWVFCHRGFTEALVLADLLHKVQTSFQNDALLVQADTVGTLAAGQLPDPLYANARSDVLRMIEILEQGAAKNEVCNSRVEVLKNYL